MDDLSLKIEYVPIDSIKPYEKNPRRNDDAVDKVAQSIREYGFQQPLVLDKDGVIIVGHTRYKAAQKLGMKNVPVIWTDMSEKKAAAYRIADNKTNQFSLWDNKLLLDELDFIGDDFFTGFELGGLFDFLDEGENAPVEDNQAGVIYEVVFKSEDKEKISEILDQWKMIADE